MLSSILIIYNTINHNVCNWRKIKILAAASATPPPTSKCTHHINLTILGDSQPLTLSSRSPDLNFFLRCWYLHLWFEFQNPTSPCSQLAAFPGYSDNLTLTPGVKFILRFLVDASKIGYLKMLVHFLVQLLDSQMLLKTWPLMLRLRFLVAALMIWISKSYVI